MCFALLLKCEDLKLFCVIRDRKLNILGFWTVDLTKQDIRSRHD